MPISDKQLKLEFRLREETIKRCNIFQLTPERARKFRPVNSELFHYLQDMETNKFGLYFRIEDTMIEYLRPGELSKELLDQLWSAMQKSGKRLEINVLKSEYGLFEQAIDAVRQEKIQRVLAMDPALDRRAVEVFRSLSAASQLVVKGGVNAEVAEQVKASASFMVSNLLDSGTAIATLSRMVIHDPTLYDHSASVAMFGGMIATRCLKKSLAPKDVEVVAQCGLYHDIGKTCVPSAVLNKPGKFTDEEFAIMKTHAALGETELSNTIKAGAPIDVVAIRVAGEHHERFQGGGYPKGKAGRLEENPESGIHLYTRIISIADVYSALLMKRVYKPAYEAQDAIRVMSESASRDFDPDIFGSFVREVVESLNELQGRSKMQGRGRILFFDEQGTLRERKVDEVLEKPERKGA